MTRAASFVILAAALAASACDSQSDSDRMNAVANEVAAEQNALLNQPAPQSVTTDSGLRFETLTPGTGPRPQAGQPVMVTYEGRLTDGTMFDSSATPVEMVVGQLIPGFNEGLLLMNKGGRYRLRIPPAIGYGETGAGGGVIPPNAELDFTVTLVDVGAPDAPGMPTQGN